jgi:predicted DCC family thiol-disulfide oxidoreductase YuxK
MSHPVLLYDGLCGFCNTSVQFILGHESRHTLRFAPLEGTFARGVIGRHPELTRVDSLVWVEGEGAEERVSVRSAAALKVARYMGGAWRFAMVFWLIPRPVRDFAYDQFAARRYRWFGRYGSCPVPDRQLRARFFL